MQGTRPVLVFHYQDSANKTRLFSCELENRRGHYLVKLLVALFLSLRVSPCLGVPCDTPPRVQPRHTPPRGFKPWSVCVCACICVTFHNPLLNAATH